MAVSPLKVSAVKTSPDYSNDAEVRHAVRTALELLELPGGFIRPGDRVVLKPNWVKEHDERRPGPNQWEHVVTHPGVIRAVAEWVGEQLSGSGRIVICDAPQTDSSFRKLSEYCGFDRMLTDLRAQFPQLDIQIVDLRPEEWQSVDGVVVSKTQQVGDPLGCTHVRLDGASEFVDYAGQGRLYGASFDMAETNRRHSGRKHDYLLCRTPMDADVFINIPKLKTHKKVGITCALKNLVGINANKNWLPHHTEGTPEDGGDQFPKATTKSRLEHSWMGAAKRWLKDSPGLSRFFVPLKKVGRLYFGDTQNVVRSGNWHGNDTCWRMVLDLNKCLFFFQGDASARQRPLRYLALVDGIIGGDGNGPMSPDAVRSGVILAGAHPAAVDLLAATIMGFDWRRIRLLKNAFEMRHLSFVEFAAGDIEVASNHGPWRGKLDQLDELFSFRPHFGWVGAIENSRQALTA